VPDRTGLVRTTLRYRVAGGCLPFDGFLPGFRASLAVPNGDVVREVNYFDGMFAVEQLIELSAQLCPRP
jgi:hypothetical protein